MTGASSANEPLWPVRGGPDRLHKVSSTYHHSQGRLKQGQLGFRRTAFPSVESGWDDIIFFSPEPLPTTPSHPVTGRRGVHEEPETETA